jgi:F420-dependent oxidoreductase-like protein
VLLSAKLAPVFPYQDLVEFWQSANELGFHAIWNYDHFYGLADPTQETLEGWTTLAAMAVIVRRARVGCMVSGVTYRHPAVLANMAVAVDHISGGRFDFGIGAAWHEMEHSGYGIDFPRAATRIEMLDEAITVIKKLWTEEATSFEGKYYRLNDARCYPKPVQKPHPPVVIGGSGPKKTLRVVANHADEWNTPGQLPEDWAKLNSILDEHCQAVGRDPKEIRRSVQLMLYPDQPGQAEDLLARLPEYEAAGCEHAVLSFYSVPSRKLLESVAPTVKS